MKKTIKKKKGGNGKKDITYNEKSQENSNNPDIKYTDIYTDHAKEATEARDKFVDLSKDYKESSKESFFDYLKRKNPFKGISFSVLYSLVKEIAFSPDFSDDRKRIILSYLSTIPLIGEIPAFLSSIYNSYMTYLKAIGKYSKMTDNPLVYTENPLNTIDTSTNPSNNLLNPSNNLLNPSNNLLNPSNNLLNPSTNPSKNSKKINKIIGGTKRKYKNNKNMSKRN
jgi:hypothetical protein